MGRRHQVDYPQVPQSRQSVQPIAHSGHRFSWMDTPIEADRRQYTNNVQVQSTNDTMPRLSEVPMQQVAELSTPETEQTEWSKSREANMTQEKYDQTLPQTHRQPVVAEQIKKPAPVADAEKKTNWAAIGPDANPLSPRSPVQSGHQARRNTNMGVLTPPDLSYATMSYQPIAQPIRGGSWRHGLCSCAEPSICMTGLFCPCLLYGKVQHRLLLKSDQKDATNLLGYKSVNGSCVAWSLLCGINGILSGIQRGRIRRAYEMNSGSGNCFSDCLEGCCCCCCVLAQNEKELKYREEQGRKAGTGQDQGYVPPGGMTFATQHA